MDASIAPPPGMPRLREVTGRLPLIVRTGGLIVGIVVGPLLLNGILWAQALVPQQAALRRAQAERDLLQLRPQLEALLAASDRALRAAPHMPAHDATGVLQFVERAGTHHQVRVSKLSAARQVAGGDLGSGPVPETISLEVEGAGRFHALANWISELETAPWLRLERWRLAPGDDRHHVHQATLTLTAVSEPIK